MKVQKTAYIIIAFAALFLCRLEATPKKTEIKPGVTTHWLSDKIVVITTTVSQQVSTEQLLHEKQQLLDQMAELQAQVAYIDSISASYADPNSQ